MKVKVEPCFSGSLRHRIQFIFNQKVCHEFVRAEEWNKAAASEALDLLQYCYGFNRRNVRFELR